MWWFWGVVILSFLAYYLLVSLIRNRRLPPGPIGYPHLGYPVRHEDFVQHFQELSERYGPIFSYRTGGRLMVVVTKAELITEALITQGEKLINRPTNSIFKAFTKNAGLVFPSGPLWREQRRFALSTLRDFGFGKPILEDTIMEETEALVQQLQSSTYVPIDVQDMLMKSVSNVICKVAFGKRFNSDDLEFEKSLKLVVKSTGQGGGVRLLSFHDWIWYIPKARRFFESVIAERLPFISFLKKIVQDHRDTFDPANDPTDYIYAFIKQQHNHEGTYFTDDQLHRSVSDLFGAGTDTTATTLRWLILLCALNPRVQEKMFEEIRNEVGINNYPRLSDRPKLPYLEAAITEVQRVSTLVPIIGRETVEDMVLAGYKIPAGTVMFLDAFAVHMDPTIYPNPTEFKPERFMDAAGKTKKDESFFPFGAGKRICIGESLARMELFLLSASLIQRFKFRFGDNKWNGKVTLGITRSPEPFDIIVEPRTD